MSAATVSLRDTTRLVPPWKRGASGEGGAFLVVQSSQSPILVVEDNIDDSFLLTRQLARANLDESVTVIGSGSDALKWMKAAASPPLAIFLDLHLPGLSGIELIREIKSDYRLRSVPIIIMTGSLNPKDVETCTKLGVGAYLPKPVELATFMKIVAHLLPCKGTV